MGHYRSHPGDEGCLVKVPDNHGSFYAGAWCEVVAQRTAPSGALQLFLRAHDYDQS